MSRVSYVMMNPGAETQLTEVVRACVDELIADLCVQVDARPGRRPGAHGRRQPDHAPPVPGPRSDGAGRRAVRAGHGRRRPPPRDRPRTCTSTRARASTCCRASPATSAPTPPGVILSEAPYQQETVNLIVDVGTNAEIVLGNRDRMLAASSPTGPGVRGRADQLRPAGGARRDRTRPDRRADAGAALHRDRRRALVRRARLRRVDGHRRVRLGHHRGDRRDVPGRHPDDRRRDRRRARGAHAADRPRRPDVLLRAARRRAAPGHHAERRPPDPAREGRALRRDAGC